MLTTIVGFVVFVFLIRYVGKHSYIAGYNKGLYEGATAGYELRMKWEREAKFVPSPPGPARRALDPSTFGVEWKPERIKVTV